jgi:CheY-like chemotaxis protein
MALVVARPVVLIVEDESLLRMSAAEMVVDAGYDVVEAGNADEAIAHPPSSIRYPHRLH